ncbi:hypothetical protein EDB19DRAFT_1896714 [Suillus lakei]|nr:hypothetical protein EDB19DRAFT_1896714 [Suillus lakei]
METSSPGTIIQHQVANQITGSANPNSNPSRNRHGNRPRTRVPPTNATSSGVVVVPETGGTSSRQPRRSFNQNRSHDHQQGSPNPRRPPGASQTAGSSSVSSWGDRCNEPNVPDSQPQSRAKRPSRRSKFNVSLTEPTPLTGDSKPEVKTHPSPQTSSLSKKAKPPRPKAPLADDLTSTVIRALSTHPYPDCPICFNPIHPSENLQCCWTTFHLKCIRAWASKCVKDLQDAWRARGEERTGEWRCPGCLSQA